MKTRGFMITVAATTTINRLPIWLLLGDSFAKLTLIVYDHHGFSSLGGLSQVVGAAGFGTDYKYRTGNTGQFDGAYWPGR